MENDTKITALNERYSIPDVAHFVRGNGGLSKLVIETGVAAAEIYLHGAQVTSWKPVGMGEILFVSEKSYWETGRAIRGGIPVCFPWFRGKADDPQAPSHGFVRTKEWNIESVSVKAEDSVCVCFRTVSDESTRKWWPFDFQLKYRVTVSRELKLELEMANTGESTLQFEEALHTYFKVGDAENVRVRGLDGVQFLDNRDGNREKAQTGDLKFVGQTDAAFVGATGPVEIIDPVLGQMVITKKQNSYSTIVWNPWAEGASSLKDMSDEEWREMACVEGGNILASAISLAPGASHTMTVAISAARIG